MTALLLLSLACRKPPAPPPPPPPPPPVDELEQARALLQGEAPGAATAGVAPAGGAPGPLSARGFEVLADPCEGGGTPYALYFRDGERGFVGCGEGVGLFGTEDGGRTFTRAHPSDDLYVFDLMDDRQGRLLVCGNDYAPTEGNVLLHRQRGAGFEPILWFSGDPRDRRGGNMSNCGRVAVLDDGTLVVASLTIGDLTWSHDGGATWAPMERYWEEANLRGQHSAWPIWELEVAGGGLYAAGSLMSESPSFFLPSEHPSARWYHLRRVVVDPNFRGEVQAMATPDDGRTWVVGGRDQDRTREASGFLHHSADGGQTFAPASVFDDIDIVKDIAFGEGGVGVAVGHRYPPAAKGGFILLTADGGRTWRPLDLRVPPLQSAAMADGTLWVAGDNFLGRGRLQ